MFVLTLNIVLSFLIHCGKRFVSEVNKLFPGILIYKNNKLYKNYSRFSLELDSSMKKNIFNIDRHILQDKNFEFLLKFGFINITGFVKLNGRIEGLKNIKETHHNYYFKRSDIYNMVEFGASELRIHYDGIMKISSINQTFLMSAVLKNVKLLGEFKIYPFERLTFHLDDVRIDELKIIACVSGLNVISLIINYTLKIMSFMIRYFVESQTKYYLNETFSKSHLSQNDVLEQVGKSISILAQTKCFRDKFEIAHEIPHKSKFGPTSYLYNLMRGLFEFHKAFNKVVITQAFNRNVEDFLSDTLHTETSESDQNSVQTNENESYSSSLISSESESGFDYSGVRQENRINSNEINSESEVDSHSTENDSHSETVSAFSETSSENEINNQVANDSFCANNLHMEENYNENESQSGNDSSRNVSVQLEESYNEYESQLENDSCDESRFLLEKSFIESESPPESESYEKISYQNYQPRKCSLENNHQSERNDNEGMFNQPNNSDDSKTEISCNNDDTLPEIKRSPEADTQSTSSFYAEEDTQHENINGDNVIQSEHNSRGEDVTQPKISFYDNNQPTNIFNRKKRYSF